LLRSLRVQSDWAGKVIDLTEMPLRISEDFGDHPGDAESGDSFPYRADHRFVVRRNCARYDSQKQSFQKRS